jgi:hypothetical protein
VGTGEPLTKVGALPEPDSQIDEAVDYCSRPKCRHEFRRAVGPGRRRDYCSDMCRRMAEKELRQAQARLVRFESIVERLRIDIAAFSKSDDDDAHQSAPSGDAQRRAESALSRADGILDFAPDPEDRAIRELRILRDAVAPVVAASRRAAGS